MIYLVSISSFIIIKVLIDNKSYKSTIILVFGEDSTSMLSIYLKGVSKCSIIKIGF